MRAKITVLIFNDINRLSVLLYNDEYHNWHLPSTEAQDGESVFEAAARAAITDAGIEININRCVYGFWDYTLAQDESRNNSIYNCFVVYHFRKQEKKAHTDNSRWFSISKLPNNQIIPENIKNHYLKEKRKTKAIRKNNVQC